MSKKFLVSLGLGAAATAVALTKLDDATKQKLAEKFDKKMLKARKRALEYRKYFKDFVAKQDLSADKLNNLTQKVTNQVENLAKNERVMDTVTSVKEVSHKAAKTAYATKQTVANQIEAALQTKVSKIEVPAAQKDTHDIVLDGRSAFGVAKAAADFESEHPTETFFPKNQK